MFRSAALAFAFALVAAGGASAETVARGVEDGSLALNSKGTPSVAYVQGTGLFVATRKAPRQWAAVKVADVTAGSNVMAFKIGAGGPVVLVQAADDRKLRLVRRRSVGWQSIRLAGGLPAQIRLGWPGLAIGRRGEIAVAFTHWNSSTLNSRLLLARVNAKGRVKTQRITFEGFPKSLVPPPAAPVIFGGRVHVIESYGYRGVLGTLEWFPQKKTWIGLNLNSGLGDFPLGPVLAGLSRGGILHAAWTDSLTYFGTAPVTLAIRDREPSSEFVLERALATGLALPSSGPEVAANEWVGSDELGLGGDGYAWAGVVQGRTSVELDGWLAGLAVSPRGGRDVLLGGTEGLRWFRSRQRLAPRVSIESSFDGSLSGTVRGVGSGHVTVYRERPGQARKVLGRAAISGGSFAFVDRSPVEPMLYRAVYVEPASGIPFAALTRP